MKLNHKTLAIILILCTFAFCTFLPSQGKAQEAVTLQQVVVNLWPEYDQPTMLVIHDITLQPGVSLPARISLRIPASAGKPNAVASRQENGDLFNLSYEQEMAGEWLQISFNATTPESRIEYYDPNLQKEGAQRSFAFRWPGDYAVETFQIQVQQPVGATNMVISPSLGSGTPSDGGLVFYSAVVGSVPAGQAVEVSLQYQKESDALSATTLNVESSAPIQDTASSRSASLESILPWVLGGLGLLLIVGGGVWYWQSGRQKEKAAARRPRHKPARQREEAPAEGFVYCHECGKRAAPGDRFCRTCGTPLRSG